MDKQQFSICSLEWVKTIGNDFRQIMAVVSSLFDGGTKGNGHIILVRYTDMSK